MRLDTNDEKWCPLRKHCVGEYEISNIGRVRRIGKTTCISPYIRHDGWASYSVSHGKKNTSISLHRAWKSHWPVEYATRPSCSDMEYVNAIRRTIGSRLYAQDHIQYEQYNQRPCLYCKTMFTPGSKGDRYCCPEHKRLAKNKRKKNADQVKKRYTETVDNFFNNRCMKATFAHADDPNYCPLR